MPPTTYYPCWCSLCLSLPPTFPFRFSTIGTPSRVQVWGRTTEKHTKVGIETSAQVDCIVFWFILSTLFYLLYLRQFLPYSFIQVCVAPQHVVANMCVYMWVHACICVCLIGIVSISKRPDSHLPSLWIHVRQRKGKLMVVWRSPGSSAHAVTDTHTHTQCKRYCKCFCIRGAMCSTYKHKWWLN